MDDYTGSGYTMPFDMDCPCGDPECRDISIQLMQSMPTEPLKVCYYYKIQCHGKESYGSFGIPLLAVTDFRVGYDDIYEILERTLKGMGIPKADWFKEP